MIINSLSHSLMDIQNVLANIEQGQSASFAMPEWLLIGIGSLLVVCTRAALLVKATRTTSKADGS